MMASASTRDVSRKDSAVTPIPAAMAAIIESGMTPGPLGMADTKPMAEAPAEMAARASPRLAMQQILTAGRLMGRPQDSRSTRDMSTALG